MIVFPNCKINLGLHIVSKRPDGYHDLETVFYPIPLCDALEAITKTELHFQNTGLPIQGNVEDNLCLKAYHLLKQDFPSLPAVHIHLHKVIPMGAGLGGGSSNGAFMLQLLNQKYNLQLSQQQLLHYALQLGSDCPFFIYNTPCFATGRGEEMTPVQIDLSAYKIFLVNPGVHVSTKAAFAALTPKAPFTSLATITAQPVASWKDQLVNDFEQTIFSQYPTIRQVKETLYSMGAVYAAMTGTGSTVFGIFKEQTVDMPGEFTNYLTRWLIL